MDEIGTYGQFGQAVYDHAERGWLFQRAQTMLDALKTLGEPKVIVKPDDGARNSTSLTDGKEGPTRRRENQVKALVKTHPELHPGSALLTDFSRVSEAVEQSASRYDPSKGNLLAFGSTTDEFAKRQVEIVAFATGATGSDLRIIQIRKHRRGWHYVKSVYVEVPTIHGEAATWTGPGVPIQSIIFANPLEGTNSFLAVRLMTQILIFRPVLRKKVGSNGSRLDVNFLVSLGLEQTGGEPYADVTFNPWYARQFAVLDQAGQCTMWELQGKEPIQVKKVASRQPTTDGSKKGNTTFNDSWGRVVWISGPSILVQCTRRNLQILEVADAQLVDHHDLELGLSDVGWILDMVQIPSQLNYIAIATSQNLIVYYLDHTTATKVVQVRHFRSSEDISLHLDCFNDGDDVSISIRSELDPTILIYRLNLAGQSLATTSDPIEFGLYTGSDMQSTRLCALHFSPIDIKSDSKQANDSTSDIAIHNARFFQSTTLHEDCSLRQILCVASANAERLSKLGLPIWERELTKSMHKVLDDDFIVDDEDDEDLARSEPVSNFARRMKQPQDRDDPQWTINHQLTERRINSVDVSDIVGIDEALEAARDTLNDGKAEGSLPFRTLKELVDIEVSLQDIESASTELDRLIVDHTTGKGKGEIEDEEHEAQRDTTLALQSITSLPILNLSATDQSHLKAVDENISNRWTRQLSNNVADIVRHSKEQLARRMIAEVSLASLVIRPPEEEPEVLPQDPSQTQSQSQDQSQGQVWELPVRPGAPVSAPSTPSIYFDAASSPKSPGLPTPSETGSSSSAIPNNSALTRLSKYTTFTPNAIVPPLSRRLNRVLSHWSVGADPATYNWAAASRHITRHDEEEAEGEEMTEKERQRQQRRTERYVNRQRREAEETARLQVLSSQAPEIVVGSQPARVSRANSQQAVDSQSQGQSRSQSQSQGRLLVASQVLPGPHGGRKPVKKKRKSGF